MLTKALLQTLYFCVKLQYSHVSLPGFYMSEAYAIFLLQLLCGEGKHRAASGELVRQVISAPWGRPEEAKSTSASGCAAAYRA